MYAPPGGVVTVVLPPDLASSGKVSIQVSRACMVCLHGMLA